MMEINHSGRLPAAFTEALAAKAVRLVFRTAKRRQPARGGLGLAFVTEAKMKKLNRERRGCNAPTDVLSFAPAEFPESGEPRQLGDIVICAAFVEKDAKKNGTPYPQQLLRVFIHGILHLMGYDHATLSEEKRMFGLQEKILKACGL